MLYLGAMILVWAAVAYLGGLAFLGIARAMQESRYEFAGVLLVAWLIGLVALSRILRCR